MRRAVKRYIFPARWVNLVLLNTVRLCCSLVMLCTWARHAYCVNSFFALLLTRRSNIRQLSGSGATRC